MCYKKKKTLLVCFQLYFFQYDGSILDKPFGKLWINSITGMTLLTSCGYIHQVQFCSWFLFLLRFTARYYKYYILTIRLMWRTIKHVFVIRLHFVLHQNKVTSFSWNRTLCVPSSGFYFERGMTRNHKAGCSRSMLI